MLDKDSTCIVMGACVLEKDSTCIVMGACVLEKEQYLYSHGSLCAIEGTVPV